MQNRTYMSWFLRENPEYNNYDQLPNGDGFYNPEVNLAYQNFIKETFHRTKLTK